MIPIRQLFFILGCFCWLTLQAKLGLVDALAAGSDPRWTKVSEIQLSGQGNHHDLAFDGSQWHVASGLNSFWWNYTPDFALLGKTTVSAVTDMRGLAYSPQLHQLIVGDNSTGMIRFVDIDGTIRGQFSTGSNQLEGLDFDDRDSSVWLGLFDGRIQHWSASGQLLLSFNGLASIASPYGWSSVVIDPAIDHLYAMHDSDVIYEFTTSGQFLGKMLDDPFPSSDSFIGNGLGLEYDSTAKLLRTTSQRGGLVTFRGVPEPNLCAIAIVAFGVVIPRRHRSY